MVIGPDSSAPVAIAFALQRGEEGGGVAGKGGGDKWTSAPGRAQLLTHLQHVAVAASATAKQSDE